MDMGCVPIARLEYTVGLSALPILKNDIKEVKPVKKLKQSEIKLWPRIVESDKEDCGLEEGSIWNSEGLAISEPSTLTDSMRSIIDAVQNVHKGLLKLYGRAIKRWELTSSSLVSTTALLKNSYLTWKGQRKTLRLTSWWITRSSKMVGSQSENALISSRSLTPWTDVSAER